MHRSVAIWLWCVALCPRWSTVFFRLITYLILSVNFEKYFLGLRTEFIGKTVSLSASAVMMENS
jgi:hypothetical protein